MGPLLWASFRSQAANVRLAFEPYLQLSVFIDHVSGLQNICMDTFWSSGAEYSGVGFVHTEHSASEGSTEREAQATWFTINFESRRGLSGRDRLTDTRQTHSACARVIYSRDPSIHTHCDWSMTYALTRDWLYLETKGTVFGSGLRRIEESGIKRIDAPEHFNN